MTDINAGSVYVDVLPDARRFGEELKAKLAGLTAVIQTKLDDTGIREQLDALSRDQQVDIRANLNDADAKARLDMLTRPRSVNVDVDKNSLLSLSSASSAVGRLASGLMSLPGLAAVVGPALIPIAGAVAGLGAALAAPALAAGGGLGVFGIVGGFAVAKAEKDLQTITELNKKISEATTGATRAKYQQELANFKKSIAPAEAQLVTAIQGVKSTFDKLLNRSGGDVIGPMVKGLQVLNKVIPKLSPILHAFGAAFDAVLGRVGKLVDSKAFDRLVSFIANTGSKAFREFANSLINLGLGFAGLMEALAPLGLSLTGSIENMTRKFAEFGQTASSNKGFQAFLAYVEQNGPKIGQLIGEIVATAGHLITALAPLGQTVFDFLDKAWGFLAKLPNGVLAPLAAGIAGLFAGPEVAAVAAGISLFKQLYDHSKDFRDIVDQIGGWIRTKLAPELHRVGQQLMPALRQAVQDIGQVFHENKPIIMALLKGMEHYLTDFDIPLWTQLAKVTIPAFIAAIEVAQLGLKAFITYAITAFGLFLDAVTAAFGGIPGIGPKLKDADASFHTFAANAIANLTNVQSNIKAIQDALNGIKPHKTVTIDVVTRNHAGAKVAGQLGIPQGATGGIVRRPTLALIGEAGPEAVVPLNKTPGNGPLPAGGFGARRVQLVVGGREFDAYVRERAGSQYVSERNFDRVSGGR